MNIEVKYIMFIFRLLHAILLVSIFYSSFMLIMFICIKLRGLYLCLKHKNRSYNYTCKEILSEKMGMNKKGYFNSSLIILLTIAIPINFLFNSAVQDFLGIHNIYLENNGQYSYYVEFYDYDTQNYYQIPAQISVEDDEYNLTKKIWQIDKIFLPNGTFYEQYDTQIYTSEWVMVFDDTGNDIGEVSLTNKHLYHENIQETNRTNLFSISTLILTLFAQFFFLGILFYERKNKSE